MSNMKNELENRQENFDDSGYKGKTLSEIKKEMEEIAGEWNGDEAGLQEDRAMIAEEIMEHLEYVRELLEEMPSELDADSIEEIPQFKGISSY